MLGIPQLKYGGNGPNSSTHQPIHLKNAIFSLWNKINWKALVRRNKNWGRSMLGIPLIFGRDIPQLSKIKIFFPRVALIFFIAIIVKELLS